MTHFKYELIDLESPSFRLIRLFKGEDGPIQCELFDAWLHDAEDIVEYEALSYTWGGIKKPYEVEVNGRRMSVTENLSLALRHLRYQYQDRILWIDAICINQDNDKERGHQVRQMASIYKRAERVIIWLGRATSETDLILRSMKQLEEESIGHACNDWKASDKRWLNIWSSVQPLLGNVREDLMSRQRKGLASLLSRSWFKRVWIIQEVANARAAEVMCGTRSVSARIFALIPSLVGITPDPHCQAVLDIMPGPTRKHTWWTQKRDLHTLLLKFGGSEASDPRDIIYALLGISSNGCDTDILVPNYEKSVKEVIYDTISFLLHFHDCESPIHCLPQWTLAEFLQNLNSLGNSVFHWAIDANGQVIVELLLERNDVNADPKDNYGRTPLWRAADRGHEAVVKLLLERNDVNADSKDSSDQTPLWIAVDRGHEAVVKLLLERDDVNANPKDNYGRTLLWRAVDWGHEAVVKLLLDRNDVNANSKNDWGETPLWISADRGNGAMVKLLLERNDVDADSKDNHGQTPLWMAADRGHEAVVRLLLERNDVNANSKDDCGRTPLWRAVDRGDEAMMKLLLERNDVDADSKDNNGQTPLWRAADRGRKAMVKLLLERNDVDADSKDNYGQTPLWRAAGGGHEAVVKLLLERNNINADSKDNYGKSPLRRAAERGHGAVGSWDCKYSP